MTEHVFEGAERHLTRQRIGVYECSLDASGIPFRGHVLDREYDKGGFSEELLKNKWMPSLASKCNMKGWAYPLLVTSYVLKKNTDVTFIKPPNRKATSKDVTKILPRKREGPEKREAVILSATEYKLLSI